MSKECPYCGVEIPEGSRFCTRCGMDLLEQTADAEQAVPAKKNRFKWWMIPLGVVLIAAVVVIAMWGRVSLYVLPELKLAEAVMRTGGDLSARLDGSPLQILGSSAQWEAGSTTDTELELTLAGFGGFGVRTRSAYDPKNHAASVTAETEIMGSSSLTAAYYGRDRAVFVLEEAGDILSCGVNFATLEEDLKNNPAIDLQTAEQIITAAEAFRLPAASDDREELNKRYLQAPMDMLGTSTRGVRYEDHVVDGTERSCGIISYTLDHVQLAAGFEALAQIAEEDEMLRSYANSQTDLSEYGIGGEEQQVTDISGALRRTAESLRQDPGGAVTVSFRIYDGCLVGAALTAAAEGRVEFSLDAVLGANAADGDILVTAHGAEGESRYLLELDKTADTYSETLTISSDEGERVVSYSWNKSTEELPIRVELDDEVFEINAVLTNTADGYTLTLPDVMDLVGQETMGDWGFLLALAELDVTMTVSKGAMVDFPSFKTPDQWTREDLDIIMEYFLG